MRKHFTEDGKALPRAAVAFVVLHGVVDQASTMAQDH
jgi:hypothetical protein